MKSIDNPSISKANHASAPHRAVGVGHRIALTASLIGSRRYASRITSISSAALQRYIKEENKPSLETAMRLCDAAGVRLEWLATGKGSMEIVHGKASATRKASTGTDLDEARLVEALTAIERSLQMAHRHLSLHERAQLVCTAYCILTEEDSATAIFGRIMQAVEDATAAEDP